MSRCLISQRTAIYLNSKFAVGVFKLIQFFKDVVNIENIDDFDLAETFNCGQCFRWNQTGETTFTGVAFNHVIDVFKEKNRLVLQGNKVEENFESIWKGYFDLDFDYKKVKLHLSQLDDNLAVACQYAPGIRILHQEPWEALCSFIISQNNNIPRIKGIIERFCELFGEEIKPGFFSFPSCETVASLGVNELAKIRCGFRDKYILDAARKVASGVVSFESIKTLPLNEARSELMKIKGVGPKVAECTLLYGFHRLEAFPVDVWMKRALDTFFPGKDPAFFGSFAGIAQQYIFHYSRMNPERVK